MKTKGKRDVKMIDNNNEIYEKIGGLGEVVPWIFIFMIVRYKKIPILLSLQSETRQIYFVRK